MSDPLVVFFIVAGIIIVGFLGSVFFKKTGWPELLFPITIGVLLGPVLNIFSKEEFLLALPLISTFTLLMMLFRGGMDLNLFEVISGSFRALFQTSANFAIVLGNDKEVFRILRMSPPSPSFSEVKAHLTRFQREISFILRTFFFVLLGLMFDLSQSSLFVALSYGIPIVVILLVIRYVVTSASTWKSPMASDKGIITGMRALGLTSALLSFIPLQYNLPNANLYTLIITNMIILTNIIHRSQL